MMRTLSELQRPSSEGITRPQLAIKDATTRTFDTPAFAGMTFHEVHTKSVLNRVQGMPFEWSINPYRGCSHACSYCFARPTHRYLNLSPGQDFEREVVVKVNCVEVLRRELAKPGWHRQQVAMGTNTDPYQRAEGRYRLMPGIIDALARGQTPFSILTKGTLITRDIPALERAAEQVPVTAAMTIGMLDRDLWRSSEPGTPSPRARLAAVRRLNAAGIPTGVMLAPIMPGLNDDEKQLTELVAAAAEAGAVYISPVVLHLRNEVRGIFWPWLQQHHPELIPLYERLYAKSGSATQEYRERREGIVINARNQAWRAHPPKRAPTHITANPHRRRPEGPAIHNTAQQQMQLW